jgi:hypothetical protein
MNSIRTFVLSSSIFLLVWLAASYATHFENTAPSPAAQQPASADAKVSADTESEKEAESIARVR